MPLQNKDGSGCPPPTLSMSSLLPPSPSCTNGPNPFNSVFLFFSQRTTTEHNNSKMWLNDWQAPTIIAIMTKITIQPYESQTTISRPTDKKIMFYLLWLKRHCSKEANWKSIKLINKTKRGDSSLWFIEIKKKVWQWKEEQPKIMHLHEKYGAAIKLNTHLNHIDQAE